MSLLCAFPSVERSKGIRFTLTRSVGKFRKWLWSWLSPVWAGTAEIRTNSVTSVQHLKKIVRFLLKDLSSRGLWYNPCGAVVAFYPPGARTGLSALGLLESPLSYSTHKRLVLETEQPVTVVVEFTSEWAKTTLRLLGWISVIQVRVWIFLLFLHHLSAVHCAHAHHISLILFLYKIFGPEIRFFVNIFWNNTIFHF